jgi:hypothetical protein
MLAQEEKALHKWRSRRSALHLRRNEGQRKEKASVLCLPTPISLLRSMSPSTPRLAILGSGLFPKQAYCPALAALPAGSFELKAIYSRSLASARSLADTAQDKLSISDIELYAEDQDGKGLEALLANDQIDAVAIALPITSQPEFILKALKAGKHVLSFVPTLLYADEAPA